VEANVRLNDFQGSLRAIAYASVHAFLCTLLWNLYSYTLGGEAYVLEPVASRFPRRLTIQRVSGELRLEGAILR
jgi:hypothetical protein